MSKKEQEQLPQEETAAQATEKTAEETAAQTAAEETPETYTVTAEQMTQMEGLAKLVADGNDKYLRLAAEYDNYRKRTAKEKENLYDTAKADTIKPFLDVYDNLVRGVNQFDESDPHRQGLELIAKQLMAVLEKLGVQPIASLGQPFDPERHNAVMHVEDETLGENTVAEVFQEGFMLGEKVLRFAMVKVAN